MSRPKRILQIIHRMGRGGIETWLMNVLRNIDSERFHLDFLVYTTEQAAFDQEIESLGSRILRCPHPSQLFENIAILRQMLSNAGPFDVIHAHGTSQIGLALTLGAQAGIPIRIAHSHNSNIIRKRRIRNYIFSPISRGLMMKYMTHGLGCSEIACRELFGNKWQTNGKCQPMYYGIDWVPFRTRYPSNQIRYELGIPQDALVVGHTGRMVAQKNHSYWAQIAKCISKQKNNAYFLIVGEGELRETIKCMFNNLGLTNRTVFTGERADIPQLLQAMDVFLFPSLYEGLGIALLEAQAVGLPCVISDTIPTEAVILENQVFWMSLDDTPDQWAKCVLHASTYSQPLNHTEAWLRVSNSRFSLQRNIEDISSIYDNPVS